LLNYQDNYIGHSSMMSNATKSCLATSLSVLHNYFNSQTKLFLDLYLTKFLDTSKLFFLCAIRFTQLFSQEYR